jgi:ornithine--oxo-acid transaminase
MKENGLLSKNTHGDIIRFAPPLVINKAQIEQAIEIIAESVKSFL